MGLLDGLMNRDMIFALGLLDAGSPKPVRTNIGAGLLSALGQAQQFEQGQEDRRTAKQLTDAKLGLLGAQTEETRAQAKERIANAEKRGNVMALLQSILGQQDSPSQYGLAGDGIKMDGVSEPMMPKRGGLASATPEQIAMLKALGGVDLRENYNDATIGHSRPAGGYTVRPGSAPEYMIDPKEAFTLQNGRVSLAPGAVEARTAMTAATEDAKARASANYSPFTSIGAGGKQEVTGSVADVLDELRQLRQQRQTNYGPPAAGSDEERKRLVDAATMDLADWTKNLTRATVPGGRGGIQVGLSPQQKAVAEALTLGNQSFMKDRYGPALEAGDAAGNTLNAVQTARMGMQKFGNTGWGAEMIGQGARVLGALGVPQAEQKATGMQMFQQAAMERLWTTLNTAKGPQTEGDADRASKTFARLANTPQANQFILDMAQAVAERDRMKATYFREALPHAQQNGDLQEIERRWSQKAPSVWSMPTMRRWAQ